MHLSVITVAAVTLLSAHSAAAQQTEAAPTAGRSATPPPSAQEVARTAERARAARERRLDREADMAEERSHSAEASLVNAPEPAGSPNAAALIMGIGTPIAASTLVGGIILKASDEPGTGTIGTAEIVAGATGLLLTLVLSLTL